MQRSAVKSSHARMHALARVEVFGSQSSLGMAGEPHNTCRTCRDALKRCLSPLSDRLVEGSDAGWDSRTKTRDLGFDLQTFGSWEICALQIRARSRKIS